MPEIAGVLLAAGGSSRLGGRSKQLLEIDGQPLVRRRASMLMAVCDPVVVVTGADAASVTAALDGLAVVLLDNPDWRAGMGGSLALAARSLTGAEALLVLLADQWRVDENDLAALCAAYRDQPDHPVASRRVGCDAGVPAIFPASLFERLGALTGDAGARGVLADPSLEVVSVGMPNAAFDLDTPADLAAFEAAQR